MYSWHQVEIEDRLREEAYLAEIGPIGRIADDPFSYILSLTFLWPLSFCVGILIGSLL